MKTMTPLSETYKELGIAFAFPIEIKDGSGKKTYSENSKGFWSRREYDEEGNETYYESSDDFWRRYEYDKDGNQAYVEDSSGYWQRYEDDKKGNRTYYEDNYGYKEGTKRGSCDGKVIEVDGKKYKLMEL